MASIYKSIDGERAIKERYTQFLKYWPVPNQHLRLATRHGETFVSASGPETAPPVILLHGAAFNSTMWMGDVPSWAQHFRLYAVDIIGDAGLSAPTRPSPASDAHALWLDDVLAQLSVTRASLVGISLGGWIAIDYATRHPERVNCLVVTAPGGIASRNVLWWALPLLLLGKRGRRKIAERVSGPPPANPSPAEKAVADFMALVFKHMRQRTASLPAFTDRSLQKLTMPVMAILGGKDVFVDSESTRARLEQNVPRLKVEFLPEARHSITSQTQNILDFLRSAHEV